MRYDRENERNNENRSQSGDNRRLNQRYHQFGSEEDRSMRDSSRDYGRFRNDESSYMADDYREQDRGYESESRSGLGGDFNFGGRSSVIRDRNYGESRFERDPYPTQNRSQPSRFERDYSMDRREGASSYAQSYDRGHGRNSSSSRYGGYEGRNEPEHHSMWESVKDFFGVGPKGYSRSDDRIREDVSEALTRDRAVDASEIEVSVMSGIVTLRGNVGDKWMKRRAEDCAEEITGVKNVRNELELSRGSVANADYPSPNSRTGSLSSGSTASMSLGSSSLSASKTGGLGINETSGAKGSERALNKADKRKLS